MGGMRRARRESRGGWRVSFFFFVSEEQKRQGAFNFFPPLLALERDARLFFVVAASKRAAPPLESLSKNHGVDPGSRRPGPRRRGRESGAELAIVGGCRWCCALEQEPKRSRSPCSHYPGRGFFVGEARPRHLHAAEVLDFWEHRVRERETTEKVEESTKGVSNGDDAGVPTTRSLRASPQQTPSSNSHPFAPCTSRSLQFFCAHGKLGGETSAKGGTS